MKRTLQMTLRQGAARWRWRPRRSVPLAAQLVVPELQYDAQIEPLKLPANLNFGEVAGVATNSKGDVFVYTRTGHPTLSLGTARPFAHGGSRMFEFDKTGKFVREIGQGVYGFLFAEKVKIDPQDNIWVVDQMANMIMEFDPDGREVMLLGRKSESENRAGPWRGASRCARGWAGGRRCGGARAVVAAGAGGALDGGALWRRRRC